MAQYKYEIVYNTDGSVKLYRFSPASDGIRYFVDNFGTQLAQSLSGTGIYLSVAIAQKSLESAFGTDYKARLYNNFGGIMNFGKLKNAGVKKLANGNPLATFNSPKDCFDTYVNILKDPSKKYIANGVFTAKTPQEQLKAIADGGYCTVPPPAQYYKTVLPVLNLCMNMFKTGIIK